MPRRHRNVRTRNTPKQAQRLPRGKGTERALYDPHQHSEPAWHPNERGSEYGESATFTGFTAKLAD